MLSLSLSHHTQSICRWLKLLQVNVPAHVVEETLQQHPFWPSLLCVSDALHCWQIPHIAAKGSMDDISQIDTPFLAVTRHPERPFAIVISIGENDVVLYQHSYRKATTMSRHYFLNAWTGVYMLAEPDAASGYKPKTKSGSVYNVNGFAPLAFLLTLTGLFLYQFFVQSITLRGNLYTGFLLFFILYCAGLLVSILLLWYDIDKANPFLQKVCTGIAKTNCNAILNSKAGKLFGVLSWSEVGFIYFAGGLLLLLGHNGVPNVLPWLAWLAVASLVYPVFSIYYQWRIARQWCTLCLLVQGILLLSGVVSLLFFAQFSQASFSVSALPAIALAYGLTALGWFAVKPLLMRLYEARQERWAYRRLKFNPVVFKALWQQQKQIVSATDGLGIQLGNITAHNSLIKVCNPHCGPCSKAHPKVEQLLRQNRESIKGQIIFMVADDEEHQSYRSAAHLMALDAQEPNKIPHALDEWYAAQPKNYKAFSQKFPVNGAINNMKAKMSAMAEWCKMNDIRYTPTLFFNGREMPKEYDLEDLNYFLRE